jgi:hypothetical protein
MGKLFWKNIWGWNMQRDQGQQSSYKKLNKCIVSAWPPDMQSQFWCRKTNKFSLLMYNGRWLGGPSDQAGNQIPARMHAQQQYNVKEEGTVERKRRLARLNCRGGWTWPSCSSPFSSKLRPLWSLNLVLGNILRKKSQLIWRFDGNLRGKQETCGQSKEERRDR